MSNDYKVHKAWINEAEFEALIIEIPQPELEDKLAYLARNKGNITKSFYIDFIIATCVANINQLLFHIKNKPQDTFVLMTVREELLEEILKINPALEPSNLIINRNFVIKLKGDEELKDGERMLEDNKSWNVSYYDESVDEVPDMENPYAVVENNLSGEIKKIEDLDSLVVKQWWRRINKYVEIKKFNEDDMAHILGQRFFHDHASFQTFIVTVCVVDAEELFMLLDNLGITANASPPTLMLEVYKLCKEVNPFLTYDNALKLFDNEDIVKPQASSNNTKSPNKMMSHAQQQKSRGKKKDKKTFKDISKEELLNLGNIMKVFVIGQDAAVDQIVESVQRASVGLKDPIKPIGSFLFAGRTGIGKSLTTKVLADELIKDRNNLITIDCSEYSADHEYAKLIGSPHGYIGHDEGGVLTNAIKENPFSVVVFDEVEKASHKVHELMLQILEEGRLTDGKGQKVSFKDAIVIMTSNIGVKEVDDVKKTIGFGDVAKLTEEKKTKAIDDAIKKKFKPEFLNRIDSVVHFNTLTKDDYLRIIDIELNRLNLNLKENDTEFKTLELSFDKRVKNFVLKHGIDEDFGARPLKRCIEKEVSTPLALRLLRDDIRTDAKIKVSVSRGKVAFKVQEVKIKEEAEDVVEEAASK